MTDQKSYLEKLSYVHGVILGLKLTARDERDREMFDTAFQYVVDLFPAAGAYDKRTSETKVSSDGGNPLVSKHD